MFCFGKHFDVSWRNGDQYAVIFICALFKSEDLKQQRFHQLKPVTGLNKMAVEARLNNIAENRFVTLLIHAE